MISTNTVTLAYAFILVSLSSSTGGGRHGYCFHLVCLFVCLFVCDLFYSPWSGHAPFTTSAETASWAIQCTNLQGGWGDVVVLCGYCQINLTVREFCMQRDLFWMRQVTGESAWICFSTEWTHLLVTSNCSIKFFVHIIIFSTGLFLYVYCRRFYTWHDCTPVD